MNSDALHWSDPVREQPFKQWFARVSLAHRLAPGSLRAASHDTSSRRYFRVDSDSMCFVIMDAPPLLEDCPAYVRAARLLQGAGLHVPAVLDWDEAHGFMLLSDLGPTTYLDRMRSHPDATALLCREASEALVRLQLIEQPSWLPHYDEARIRMELAWFPDWYVSGYFGASAPEAQDAGLEETFDSLVSNFQAQPQIMVHRDFHSRNLMFSSPNPGVLDFQGAVWGPAAYDLVSLLRDAYIEWDGAFQVEQARAHWSRARNAGVAMPATFDQFWCDFEMCGLQRQLKVLGFFARLSVRDGRHEYIPDMPRVWGFALRTARRYAQLQPLAQLLERLDPTRHPAHLQ